MKQPILLALMCLSLAACSNEEPLAETAATLKNAETPSVFKTKPDASAILTRYGLNKTNLGYDKATDIFASECKVYLNENGHTTQDLDNAQIINLFLKNF